MSRLKDLYNEQIVDAMTKKFGYKNVMEVPKLSKIVINMGVGEAKENAKLLDAAISDMEAITGQKAVTTKAKNSVANFKIREGMPIGCKVTLRGEKMYEFADRLINLALPRVRDFRGVNPNAFDGRGNYALGIKEQLIFPEIEYDKVDKVRGMDIIFVTTANTDEEAREFTSFFICVSSGNEDNVHTSDFINFIILDLWENQLLFDTKSIVSSAIESVRIYAAEVTYTRQCQVDQAVCELVHFLATKGNFASDRHTLTDFKVCYGIFRFGGNCFLSGDSFHITDCSVQKFSVLLSFTNTHVDYDFGELRHFHHVFVSKFFGHCINDLLVVKIFQSTHGFASSLP